MPTRLLIAYLLILAIAGGLTGAVWWTIHNSHRQRLKRYYREKRERAKL